MKRMCVQYPDGSINIVSVQSGPIAAMNEARREAEFFNKGEKNRDNLALAGEIEIDLMSFREKC